MKAISHRKIKTLVIVVFSLLGILVIPSSKPTGEAPLHASSDIHIIEIIDGDTVKTKNETIRLIGIDTPEKGENGYGQAKKVMTNLVLGKTVVATKGKDTYDKYGRALYYLHLDEVFINKQMIDLGCAKTLAIKPNTLYEKEFKDAETEARKNNLGIWGDKDCSQ